MNELSLRASEESDNSQSGESFQEGFPSYTVEVDRNFRISGHLFDADYTSRSESVVMNGHSDCDFALIILLSGWSGYRGIVGRPAAIGCVWVCSSLCHRTTAYASETCSEVDLGRVVVRPGSSVRFVGRSVVGS